MGRNSYRTATGSAKVVMIEIGPRPPGGHPHPLHWAEVREIALKRDQGCRGCGSLERLECHHRTYANWGRETPDDITVLCRDCHDLITGAQMRIRDERREPPSGRIVVEVERFEAPILSSLQTFTRVAVSIERPIAEAIGGLPLPRRNHQPR